MSVTEYRQLTAKKKKGNKYGAKSTYFNGRFYPSLKQAEWAKKYQLLRFAKDPNKRVVKVEEEITYTLKLGNKIFKYRLDFKITYADGRIEHTDPKGYKKGTAYNLFQLKKALMKDQYGIDIIEL